MATLMRQPVAFVFTHDSIGQANGLMTTIHVDTDDQVLTDAYHEDPRRPRDAAHKLIATRTGAAAAVGMAMPELDGRLDGYANRVPTIEVSLVDLSFVTARDMAADEINAILKTAAVGEARGILGYSAESLVSSQFNHDPRSSIFGATLTKVSGRVIKVSSWCENEWVFSSRTLDTTVALLAAKCPECRVRRPWPSGPAGSVLAPAPRGRRGDERTAASAATRHDRRPELDVEQLAAPGVPAPEEDRGSMKASMVLR